MRHRTPLFGALLWCLPALALAQNPNAAPPRCDTPKHRQFDFWVGDWTVGVAGQYAGSNNVTLEEDGCIVHEHWTGSKGGTGQSFNFYDRADGQWHQLWVDNAGNVVSLSGTYAAGKLAYAGVTPGSDGKPVKNRLTFFNNPDGTVRQLWEVSADDGKNWQPVFDGLYRKRQ